MKSRKTPYVDTNGSEIYIGDLVSVYLKDEGYQTFKVCYKSNNYILECIDNWFTDIKLYSAKARLLFWEKVVPE